MENNFSKNLKIIRETKRISQQEIADKIGVDRSTIGYWENGKADPTMLNVIKLAETLNVDIVTLIGGNLNFDNADFLEPKVVETIQIPVLGIIKAGTPIEAQENILEYIDIPKEWIKGGKRFYGLKISGDSMFPKYQPNDIVIFEQNEDTQKANGKDCAVMVNGYDATFKKFTLNDNGVILTPLNQENSDGYQTTFYNIEQVLNLPVKIVGIAVEKRTRL